MNIQKILVPVDGSTASFEAFMWACELASRFQAQVHMVYMVDARKQVAGAGRVPIGIESGEAEARKEGVRVVEEYSKHAPPGITVEKIIAVGPPAEGIVRLASTMDIDPYRYGKPWSGGGSPSGLWLSIYLCASSCRVPGAGYPGEAGKDRGYFIN